MLRSRKVKTVCTYAVGVGYMPYMVGGGPEGVCLIVDSTTISILFYNLQGFFRQNLQVLLPKKNPVYKSTRFWPEKKYNLQGFFSRIYSLRIDWPPL